MRAPRWSVRSRILASILLVAFIGMSVAGITSFFVQRDRIHGQIDDLLLAHVESARFVVTGESAVVPTDPGAETPPTTDFTTTAEALEAVLARVIPGRNESALGIVDGEATLVPGVDIAFHLEDDPEFVDRVVRETEDGAIHMGTDLLDVGTVRYIATPIAIEGDPDPAVYVAAVDLDAALGELRAAFGTYAVVAPARCSRSAWSAGSSRDGCCARCASSASRPRRSPRATAGRESRSSATTTSPRSPRR